MREVILGTSGLKTSPLGFGCSAIMGRVGRKQSLRALSAAHDAGITFFDTARSYGYGESEAVVGEFLKGRRHRVILSTKFGIVPVQQGRWKRALMPVVRSIVDAIPWTRSVVRTQVRAQLRENQITREVLQSSLDESLRKLRSDYVDILFIHSPPSSSLAQNDLLEDLEKLVIAGKIRMAGISASSRVIAAALKTHPTLFRAMQFPVNLFDVTLMRSIAEARHRGLSFVANHPFGGTEGVIRSLGRLSELAALPSISPELRVKLRSKDDAVLPEIILNLILRDTGIQVVIPSMMKVDHLRANVRAVSNCRFAVEELAWIRSSLARLSHGDQPQAMDTAR